MHLRLILAAAFACGLSSAAQAQVAQVITTCGAGVTLPPGPGGRLFQDTAGNLCTTGGSGGGGSSGSVTAPGTAGTQAQAVQGVPGGVPQNVANGGTFAVQNTAATPAGANAIGSVLSDLRVSGAAVAVGNPVYTAIVGTTATTNVAIASGGGISSFSRIPSSAASTNLTTAKAGAGRAYTYQGCNTTASTVYMRIYNAASTAAVTVGTTTPFAGPYAFPANTCVQTTTFAADIGVYASAGLTYAFGTSPLDSDTAAITAGAITAFQVGYQ